MRELTKKLPNLLQGKEPQYQTEATSFYTTFYNLNWNENGRIPIEEVAERVNGTLEKRSINEEKFGVNDNGSEKKFGDSPKSSERRFGEVVDKPKNIGKTAQKIIDFVISDPSISAEAMAYKIRYKFPCCRKTNRKIAFYGYIVS